MKKPPLTAAAQNDILSQFPWLPNGKIRVTCTIRTEQLLRAAGHEPRPLEAYDIDVRRDESGFLTINPYTLKPQLRDDDAELYQPGGILYGETPPAVERLQPAPGDRAFPVSPPSDPEALAALAELRQITSRRTFEIPTGSSNKIRVIICSYQDESLPAPQERENWQPTKTTDTDVRAAVVALHLSRRLADLELL
jgi:hypothetical protein